MKTKSLIVSMTAIFVAVAFVGCDKNKTASSEPTTPPAPNAAAPAAPDATATTPPAAPAAAAPEAAPAVPEAAAAATNAVSTATDPFTDGIANAKKMIADKNYQGALDELKKLSSLQLSDEQQKMVNDLKDQVTKLLSGGTAGAADAAKGLLGK